MPRYSIRAAGHLLQLADLGERSRPGRASRRSRSPRRRPAGAGGCPPGACRRSCPLRRRSPGRSSAGRAAGGGSDRETARAWAAVRRRTSWLPSFRIAVDRSFGHLARSRSTSARGPHRQRHAKDGLLSGPALALDRAAVGRDDLADDRQPQAAAAWGRVAGHAEIPLENQRQILGGDAASRCRPPKRRPCRRPASAASVIRPPCGVWAKALSSRFCKACWN